MSDGHLFCFTGVVRGVAQGTRAAPERRSSGTPEKEGRFERRSSGARAARAAPEQRARGGRVTPRRLASGICAEPERRPERTRAASERRRLGSIETRERMKANSHEKRTSPHRHAMRASGATMGALCLLQPVWDYPNKEAPPAASRTNTYFTAHV